MGQGSVTDERPSSRPWTAPPVIAIGGGLAGAAFAIELARHGVRVIVLESWLVRLSRQRTLQP